MHKGKLFICIACVLAVVMLVAVGCSRRQQTPPPTTPPAQPTTRPQPPAQPTQPRVVPQQPQRQEEAVPRDLSFTTVYFDFDRSDIRTDQRSAMERNARLLSQYQTVRIRLEGHCDERGTEEYNMALGQRRADAVMQYLTSYGISGSRITTISYGEMRPAATGQNETAWSQNRRCEIVITAR